MRQVGRTLQAETSLPERLGPPITIRSVIPALDVPAETRAAFAEGLAAR
jgi:hypothetical protein